MKTDSQPTAKPSRSKLALVWLVTFALAGAYCFAQPIVADWKAGRRAGAARIGQVQHAHLIPIEQVRGGDRVWSCDPATGDWSVHSVLRPLVHDYAGDVVTIKVGGSSVQATGNHPFWVAAGTDLSSRPPAADVPPDDRGTSPNGRWVEARALQPGDLLLVRSGEVATVEEIASRREKLKVYNLEVADLHTYAVGADGIVVHNKALQIAAIREAAPITVNLWEEGARAQLRGGGVYLLRDAETGQILKVGKTSQLFSRSGDYMALQRWAGKLKMEVYPIEGNLQRGAAESALRESLVAQGEGLFWDASGKRAVRFGFNRGEWNLKRLVREFENFGKEGWSMPLRQP